MSRTKLCEGLTIILRPKKVLRLLGHILYWKEYSYQNVLKDPFIIPHKVIAAIAIDDPDLVVALLPLLSDLTGWESFPFGATLNAAIARGSETVLNAILQWLEGPGVQDVTLKEVLTSDKYGFNISSAIYVALRRHDCHMLQLLVDF